MRVTAIQAKTERKRQDKSARCAEKLRCRAGMTRVRGLIRPTPGVWATADTARSERRLINWQDQAILLADGSPLGECRMITFYTHPMSRGRIARWMLEEIGKPYDSVILDYGTTMKAPEYLAINPMGKVPAIVHDGAVVTEVAAICTYLAMTFPEAGLMADDKAAFFRWMFFGAGPVEQAVVNASFGWKPGTPQEAGRTGYGSLDTVLRTLTDHLARHDFIADGRFTAADVYVGSQVGWGLQFKTMPENPVLSAYWDRIKSRPARLAADAKDNALLSRTP
jgi:glutathione S-transferase